MTQSRSATSGRGRRIPPNFFGFGFGLAGLAEIWLVAASQHRAPAVVAIAALYWLVATRPAGYRAEQYLVLAAITVLIGAIAVRTVIALLRGTLLPAPPPSAEHPAGPAAT